MIYSSHWTIFVNDAADRSGWTQQYDGLLLQPNPATLQIKKKRLYVYICFPYDDDDSLILPGGQGLQGPALDVLLLQHLSRQLERLPDPFSHVMIAQVDAMSCTETKKQFKEKWQRR